MAYDKHEVDRAVFKKVGAYLGAEEVVRPTGGTTPKLRSTYTTQAPHRQISAARLQVFRTSKDVNLVLEL